MNDKQMQINQKINKTPTFKRNWTYSAETKSTSKFKTWVWIWTSEFSSRANFTAKIFLNQGLPGQPPDRDKYTELKEDLVTSKADDTEKSPT